MTPRRLLFRKQFVDPLETIIENPPYIAAHFQRVNNTSQQAERQPVSNHIGHSGSAGVGFKAVGVVPQPVGVAKTRTGARIERSRGL